MTAAECEAQGGACPQVCLDMTPSEVQCATSCYDGCYCAPGFYLLNTSCVPRAQCPCYHQGELHEANTTFPADACNNWYCPTLDMEGRSGSNWVFVSETAPVLVGKWRVDRLPALVGDPWPTGCFIVLITGLYGSAWMCGP